MTRGPNNFQFTSSPKKNLGVILHHGVPKETLTKAYGVSKVFLDELSKKTVTIGDGSVF